MSVILCIKFVFMGTFYVCVSSYLRVLESDSLSVTVRVSDKKRQVAVYFKIKFMSGTVCQLQFMSLKAHVYKSSFLGKYETWKVYL